MFEGYEDAKTALLSSILIQIGEHKTLGPKVKEKIVGLLKRVKWMELAKAGVKHVGVPLASALLTGGIGGVVAAAGSAAAGAVAKVATGDNDSNKNTATSDIKEDGTGWSDLIAEAPGKPDLLEVRRFRDEFAAMLAETDLESLVILIDDLDRCLPERIIETLEAIKLFVAVPKTAFVIGADPRIVRHAIATRYAQKELPGDSSGAADEQYDLVKDYLEKLIQIPYHLPRLSPSEIETYVNLLACEQSLGATECGKVVAHWQTCRKKNLYLAYRQTAICDALGSVDAVPKDLLAQLAWSNAIADVVTDGLKGNPRQVKRMLNAMALRKQLATVAEIQIRDDVLAKLMVLEYARPLLFQDVSQWQATDSGLPRSACAWKRLSRPKGCVWRSRDGPHLTSGRCRTKARSFSSIAPEPPSRAECGCSSRGLCSPIFAKEFSPVQRNLLSNISGLPTRRRIFSGTASRWKILPICSPWRAASGATSRSSARTSRRRFPIRVPWRSSIPTSAGRLASGEHRTTPSSCAPHCP